MRNPYIVGHFGRSKRALTAVSLMLPIWLSEGLIHSMCRVNSMEVFICQKDSNPMFHVKLYHLKQQATAVALHDNNTVLTNILHHLKFMTDNWIIESFHIIISLPVLMAIYPDESGLASFIEPKDDGCRQGCFVVQENTRMAPAWFVIGCIGSCGTAHPV